MIAAEPPSSLAPCEIELNAARSSVRSPAPSMRRTSGEPTAAERRPERRALLGIALHSPFLTWWGSYSITSLSQLTFDITGASLPRQSRLPGICPPHPDRTGREDGEPIGLTVFLTRAPIMKVAARHEADSKIDEQLHCSWRRCRWPRPGPVPEVYSGSLRWPIGQHPVTESETAPEVTTSTERTIRMRRSPGGRHRFLGVRLTEEEERQIRHRAEKVRTLGATVCC